MARWYLSALILILVQSTLIVAQSQSVSLLVEWKTTIDDISGFDYIDLIDEGLVVAVGMSRVENNTLSVAFIDVDRGEVVKSINMKMGGASSTILCLASLQGDLIIVVASDYILYKNVTLIEASTTNVTARGSILLEPSATPYTAYCKEKSIYIAGSIIAKPGVRVPYLVEAITEPGNVESTGEAIYNDYINSTITSIALVGENLAASIRPILGASGSLGQGSKILLINRSSLDIIGVYDFGSTATMIGIETGGNGNVIVYGYDSSARGKIVALDGRLLQPIYTITLETPSIISAVRHYDNLVVGIGIALLGGNMTKPILIVYNESRESQEKEAKTYTADLEGSIIVTDVLMTAPEEYIIAGSMNGEAFAGKLSIREEAIPTTTHETTQKQGQLQTLDPVTLMLAASTIVLTVIALSLAFMIYKKRRLASR